MQNIVTCTYEAKLIQTQTKLLRLWHLEPGKSQEKISEDAFNDYLEQKYIELFETNNQKLQKNWKIHTSVRKIYDKESKTYIFSLHGSSPVPVMFLPKEKKDHLCICLPFVVFQICSGLNGFISIDFYVTSSKNVRRRITVSSKQKTESITTLSAQLPLPVEKEVKWLHLLIDLENIVSAAWKNDAFSSINCLRIGGSCKLKRIFSLRRDMINKISGPNMIFYSRLPRHLFFSEKIPQSYLYVSICNSNNDVCKDEVEKYNDSCSIRSATSSVSSFKSHSSKSTPSYPELSAKSSMFMPKETVKINQNMIADNYFAAEIESEKEISGNHRFAAENNSLALPSLLSKLSFLEHISDSNKDEIPYI
ncbi:uncharacterized protein [Parasteatoda tepidariorum]|uniref:uncharacterized protein isoform X1 n=1 Tax=Parasteatoda tepidariorum TaxID=114398 RepID=UPI001C725FC2|nr:uncharacterized protein LOC107441437 isoform X1 [Parasteatoda tepidariorum]